MAAYELDGLAVLDGRVGPRPPIEEEDRILRHHGQALEAVPPPGGAELEARRRAHERVGLVPTAPVVVVDDREQVRLAGRRRGHLPPEDVVGVREVVEFVAEHEPLAGERALRAQREPPGVGREGVRAERVDVGVLERGGIEQRQVQSAARRRALHARVQRRGIGALQPRAEARAHGRHRDPQADALRERLGDVGRLAEAKGARGAVLDATQRRTYLLLLQDGAGGEGEQRARARGRPAFHALEGHLAQPALVGAQREHRAVGVPQRAHARAQVPARAVPLLEIARHVVGSMAQPSAGPQADGAVDRLGRQDADAFEDDLAHDRALRAGSPRLGG